MDLQGKTAVVTGAASGIGRAMAERFAAAGMKLVLADIEEPALEATAADMQAAGHEVTMHLLDVRDLDQVRALEAAARERFGNVHVLCNNAGVGGGGPVFEADDIEMWRWTIDINLWGVIYGCKVFLPGMLEHGEPGRIVNTASMAGLGAAPFMGSYNVSKYGVVALSETLTQELQFLDSAIGVSVLCPAFVKTKIAESGRNLPDDLAAFREDPDAEPNAMQKGVRAMVAAGIDTSIVADAVHDAIVGDEFWILTHDEARAVVLDRARQIADGVNPQIPPGWRDLGG